MSITFDNPIIPIIPIDHINHINHQNLISTNDDNNPSGVLPDGTKYWSVNGQLNRSDDKPALIYTNGNQCWYVNNLLHRDHQLPAIVNISENYIEFYLHGIFVQRISNIENDILNLYLH